MRRRGRAHWGGQGRAREQRIAGTGFRAAGCTAGGLGSARRAGALRRTPWGGACVGARRARAQRQRRSGRAPRGCWAHTGAGMRPARRARAGDRPCILLFRRSRAYSEPCAAAALCPRGHDVAKGLGSEQTCHSAHKRQGRATDSAGTLPCTCSGAGDVSRAEAAVIRARARRSMLCDGQEGSACGLALRCATGEARRQHDRMHFLRTWRMCHLRLCARRGALVAAEPATCWVCCTWCAPASGRHLLVVRLWLASCVGQAWGTRSSISGLWPQSALPARG